MNQFRHAAIDVGTNSFHLLVASIADDGEMTVEHADKQTVRLGEAGLGEPLSAHAIDRGVATLARFVQIATGHGADVSAVATSATREAPNGSEFVRLAKAQAGVEVRVVDGAEEARLIYAGVRRALPDSTGRVLMADIGGGSTEFVIARGGEVVAARSAYLGHLRLTDRFFAAGVIGRDSVDRCRAFVRSELRAEVDALAPHRFDQAVGSSGTINEIGALIVRRTEAPGGSPAHGGPDGPRQRPTSATIDRKGLHAVIQELTAWSTPAERLEHVPGLVAERADVLVAGALLLEGLFEAFSIDEMITSPFALREGVLFDAWENRHG